MDERTTDGASRSRAATIVEEEGRFAVTATVTLLGDDCLVVLTGGTKPHIGAVGMAQVRPSLSDPGKGSATSSVFTYLGHKEDAVAKGMSEELARRLQRNTVVVAGIHWDNLTAEDILTVTTICRKVTKRITETLSR